MKKTLTIITALLISVSVFSQSRWVHTYLEDENPTRGNLVTCYDHGYLITGRYRPNWPKYNYMIKTDINGEVLWNKTLGDGYNGILPGGSAINGEGCIYFSGSFGIVGAYKDPLILKLNACGEKEWCRIFPTEGYHDYGMGCCVTPDDGVAFVMIMTGNEPGKDRICFARFASNGDFLWKQCYNINDTVAMGNELAYCVISTPDSGFLLTGDCYYSNPEDSLSYLCPYYIMADYNGDMQWYTVAGFHPFDVSGEGYETTLSPDSSCYYSGIRHNFWEPGNYGNSAPGLLKMDLQGNVIDVYDIADPNTLGTISSLKFITDTTIAAAAVWGPWSGTGGPDMDENAVILDTLGNLLEQCSLLKSNWLGQTAVTFDKKLLYFFEDVDENDKFDVYLFKLNRKLEGDTVYNRWFNYDSLCPYQVTSDTIPIEGCGLIVGNELIKANPETEKITIFPNPAHTAFTVRCSLFEQQNCFVEIMDMLGRKVTKTNTVSGVPNVTINTTGWQKGLYLVRVSHEGKVVCSERVLVE